MNSKHKGLKIYSWTRFLLFITVLISIAFLAGGFVFKSTATADGKPEYDTVVVMAGDTLWEIAHEYNSGDKDVRNYVKEICSVNEIEAGDIHPGQTIKIPTV